MPKRIQRKRIKGWRMPPNTLYVGRPSRWGNPFTDSCGCTCRTCVTLAYERALGKISDPAALYPLRGKDLACWCPVDGPCHADMLLIAANWSDQSEKTKAEFDTLRKLGEAIDVIAAKHSD